MTSSFGVLLSAAGRRVALLRIFRAALDELGLDGAVVAVDRTSLSPAFHVADHSCLVPDPYDRAFVPTVLDVCRETGVRLVVPTHDRELPVYAAAAPRFADEGVNVAIPSVEAVSIGQDKSRTHAWLVANGFPTVRQASLEDALADPVWPLPCIAKPRVGSASIGVQMVRSRADLERLDSASGVIVQTLATGLEYTVDVLVDRGRRAVCAVPRRRIEVRAGEVSKGVTVRSERVASLARQVCERLPGAYGAITIQIFHDEATDRADVIEINPRFGGGFPLTWQAGGRYPRWMIEEIVGAPSTASDDGWRDDLVMLRYDEAVFVEAASVTS